MGEILRRDANHTGRSARTLGYGNITQRSAMIAAHLHQHGIKSGDRVLVAIWPSISLHANLAALWRLGAVAVFPETATGLAGLCHAAVTLQSKAIIGERGSNSFQENLSQPAADALISFISGTTGLPKELARSHDLLLAQYQALSPY